MIEELIKITDEADKLLNALFEVLEMLFNIWSKKKLNKEEENQVSNSMLGQLIKTFKNEWETGIESKQNHIIENVLKNDPKRTALFSAEVLKKEEPKLTKIIEKDPEVFKAYKIRMETLKRNKEVGIDDSVETFLEKKQDVDYLKNLKEISEETEEEQIEAQFKEQTEDEEDQLEAQFKEQTEEETKKLSYFGNLKQSFDVLKKGGLSADEKNKHEDIISKSPSVKKAYEKIKDSIEKTFSQDQKKSKGKGLGR